MFRFPLRYLLPMLLLIFGAIQAITILWISSVQIEKNLNNEAINQFRTEMTRLQGTIQFLARIQQEERIQAEMSALGSDIHLIIAAFLNQNNLTLAANKIEYRDIPIDKLLQITNNHSRNLVEQDIREIRSRMRGNIWLMGENNKTLLGIYPVILPGNSTTIRPDKIGLLYLEKDLTATDNMVKQELLQQSFIVLAVLILISIAIVLLLNRVITQRIEQLVNATTEFAQGASKTRSNIPGNDEIAHLSLAFDEMADQVTATQERLAAANSRLQLIMDSTAEAIFGVDKDATCIFANNACLTLLGYDDVSQLVGVDMRHIIVNRPLSDANSLIAYDGQMFLPLIEGNPRHVDKETLFRKDGSRFNSEYWSYPLKSKQLVVGAVVTILDISRRVEAQKALAQYQDNLESLVKQRTKQLEISNRELSSYSYSIAHDLRTPLRAITSFSQILLEDAGNKLNESELDAIHRITSAGKHMAELIDDILELSKLSRSNLNLEVIDLSLLAKNIFDHTKQAYPNKSAKLKVQPNLSINADKTLIAIVLENLFVNAMKYHTRKTINIEVGCQTYHDHFEYYVKDNGIGIDMRFAQKIFQPFERLHNPDQFSGTGVGLSIVKRIIERHGGKVWVSSQLHAGSTFFFSVPNYIEKHQVI